MGKLNKKYIKKIIQNYLNFELKNLKTLIKKIIPFFINFPIARQNLLDFQYLCKVANLREQKAHVTIEVLNKNPKIQKKGLNRGRVFPS